MSRRSGCAMLVEPPGVRTCARFPSVNRQLPPSIVLDMDSSESPAYGEQKAAPIMGISAARAIIRCSCLTSSAMSSGACCDPAICTAPVAGARCWSQ